MACARWKGGYGSNQQEKQDPSNKSLLGHQTCLCDWIGGNGASGIVNKQSLFRLLIRSFRTRLLLPATCRSTGERVWPSTCCTVLYLSYNRETKDKRVGTRRTFWQTSASAVCRAQVVDTANAPSTDMADSSPPCVEMSAKKSVTASKRGDGQTLKTCSSGQLSKMCICYWMPGWAK